MCKRMSRYHKKNHYSIESERPSVFDSVISTSIINSKHQPEKKNIKALTNEKLKNRNRSIIGQLKSILFGKFDPKKATISTYCLFQKRNL